MTTPPWGIMLHYLSKHRMITVALCFASLVLVLVFLAFSSQSLPQPQSSYLKPPVIGNDLDKSTVICSQPLDTGSLDKVVTLGLLRPYPQLQSFTSIVLAGADIIKAHLDTIDQVNTEYYYIQQSNTPPTAEIIQRALSAIISSNGAAKIVGVGNQDRITLKLENSVLWVVQSLKLESTIRHNGDCFYTDVLETDFIIRTETLKNLLGVIKPSMNSYLEIFLLMSEHASGVWSCPHGQSQVSVPFVKYSESSPYFQSQYHLLDVIDERIDPYDRKHGTGPKQYCNTTHSKLWFQKNGKQIGGIKKPMEAFRAWKRVLDKLGLPMNIFAGTFLGWYRQCNIIPYTNDIDTTLPIEDWDPMLIEEATKEGFKVERKYGNSSIYDPIGGFELTFFHPSTENRVDIFFSYQDLDGKAWCSLWINGVLNRLYYPKGTIRDTTPADFLGVDIMIPKKGLKTLVTQYNVEWETPIKKWEWWRAPSNRMSPPFKPWPTPNDFKFVEFQ